MLYKRTHEELPYIDLIRQLMSENNLSQQAFANAIGVNQTTISQWLLGKKHPSYDNIKTICEKFAITPNVFFGYE